MNRSRNHQATGCHRLIGCAALLAAFAAGCASKPDEADGYGAQKRKVNFSAPPDVTSVYVIDNELWMARGDKLAHGEGLQPSHAAAPDGPGRFVKYLLPVTFVAFAKTEAGTYGTPVSFTPRTNDTTVAVPDR